MHAPDSRANFSTKAFVAEAKLQPVAGHVFRSQAVRSDAQ